MHGLDAVCDLDQLMGGEFSIGEGRRLDEFLGDDFSYKEPFKVWLTSKIRD